MSCQQDLYSYVDEWQVCSRSSAWSPEICLLESSFMTGLSRDSPGDLNIPVGTLVYASLQILQFN